MVPCKVNQTEQIENATKQTLSNYYILIALYADNANEAWLRWYQWPDSCNWIVFSSSEKTGYVQLQYFFVEFRRAKEKRKETVKTYWIAE